VLVIDPDGNPLPDGVLLNLFIRPAATAKNGTYSIAINGAACTGVSATSMGVSTESGSIVVSNTGSGVPALTRDGVLNAASLLPGSISPGEVITMMGSGLGSGSLRLLIGQLEARILYSDAKQINAVVPDTLPGNVGAHLQLFMNEAEAAAFDVAVSTAAPGIFTRNMAGNGYANALNADGSLNTPATPAARGSTMTVWITGSGSSGSASAPALAVSVGGAPATLVDAIPVADNPAVVQVRFVVPVNTAAGSNVDLNVNVGNALSQAAVWVSIR
jgi:uncharacterized protein (TIGR03437 family)